MVFSIFKKCESNNSASTVVGSILASLTAVGAGLWMNIADVGNLFGSSELSGVSFVDSRSRDRVVDLRGQWRFSVGDDPAWASRDFDDHGWSLVDVPDEWEAEGYESYNGYAWYRRSFRVPAAALDHPLYVLVGRIDDVDEVFVNGTRVGGTGQFPPDYVTAYNLGRAYPLPAGLLESKSENVVAVRVYDGGRDGGIRSGTIGIYSSDLPRPLIDLGGIWKLKTGDNPEWGGVDADENDFVSIKVPGQWDDAGFDRYDGYAWYRKSFRFDELPADETLVMLLGRIDDTDEAYLNGVKIGSTGFGSDSEVPESDAYAARRAYMFSSSLLKDENVLAVRVHDTQSRGGIYEGPIGIMTEADYDAYWKMIEENRGNALKTIGDWLLGRN